MPVTKIIDVNEGDGHDYHNLADAIDAWEADDTDTDWTFSVRDGTYNGASNRGITAAPTQAGKKLTIQAETPDSTGVIFDGDNSGFWMRSSDADFASLTLRDLRIQDYHTTDAACGGALGITIDNFTLTFDTCYWYSNQCNNGAAVGGAIYFGSSGGTFSDTNSTYDTNSDLQVAGGALFLEGAGGGLLTGTISGCTYKSNVGQLWGGALVISLHAHVTIDDCDFGDEAGGGNKCNSLSQVYYGGGAIFIQGTAGANDTNVTITNSRFYRNGGYSGVGNTYSGGAILAQRFDALTLTDCIFDENEARIGGGICFNTGTVRIDRCSFVGNHAQRGNGGGIAAVLGTGYDGTKAVDVKITNSLFDANHNVWTSTQYHGGAIYFQADSADGYSYISTNNTYVNNVVSHATGQGAGIAFIRYANSPVLYSYNDIFWGNSSSGYEDIYNNNAACTVNVDYCTYETGEIGGDGTENITNSLNDNPLFVGGSDYSLQFSSPAKNAGSDAYIAGYATDLAGNDRTVGTVDMGAYEYQGLYAFSSIWGLTSATIDTINGTAIENIDKVDGKDIT